MSVKPIYGIECPECQSEIRRYEHSEDYWIIECVCCDWRHDSAWESHKTLREELEGKLYYYCP